MADISLNIALSIQEAANSINKFTAQATSGLDKVAQQSKKTSDELEGIARSTSISGQAIGTFFGEVAVRGMELAAESAHKLFEVFIVQGVEAYNEAEIAVSKLNSALASQGDLTKQNQEDLLKQAEALQSVTKFQDDAIINIQALIGNLTNLDVNGIKKVTASTLDFASALGIDAETAATTISKALEGNVGALNRYGVAVKKGKTETETFNNVMQALSVRFGGAAEALGNTFSGATTKLANQFNQLQEQTGSIIANNPAIIEAINQASKIFEFLAGVVEKNKQAFIDFAGQLVASVSGAFTFLIRGVEAVDQTFAGLGRGFSLVVATIAKGFLVIQGASSEAIKAVEDAYQKEAEARNQSLEERQKFYDEAAAMSDEAVAKIQEQVGKEQEIANTKFQNDQQREDAKEAQRQANAQKEQDAIIAEIDRLNARNEALRTINTAQANEEIAANEVLIQTKIDQVQRGSDEEIKIKAKQEQIERAQLNRKLDGTKQFFGGLASLSRTGNSTLFEIGKVAAYANAVVSGAQAFMNALAQVPYPFNIAAAAGIAVTTGVELAEISATHLAGGITEVPAGFSADNFPAFLQSGERVVTAEQNKDLKNFLSQNKDTSGQITTGLLASIDAKLNAALNRPIVVEISGREVFRTVDAELIGGRVFST